jgi:adenylate cyclase
MASPETVAHAIQFYNQAIQIDTTFVAALFEAALACIVQVGQGWVPPLEGFPQAMNYAERALQLDPNDSDVLATTAFIGSVTRGAGDEWVAMSTRAIALNSNSAFAFARSGWVHTCSAKPETAIAHFERALRLSPKDMANWDVWTGLGYALFKPTETMTRLRLATFQHSTGRNFRSPGVCSSPPLHLADGSLKCVRQFHVFTS